MIPEKPLLSEVAVLSFWREDACCYNDYIGKVKTISESEASRSIYGIEHMSYKPRFTQLEMKDTTSMEVYISQNVHNCRSQLRGQLYQRTKAKGHDLS